MSATDTQSLDALNMIEAFAAGDSEAAYMTAGRYAGQEDQLAIAVASVAALMLTTGRAPVDELAAYRRWLLAEIGGAR